MAALALATGGYAFLLGPLLSSLFGAPVALGARGGAVRWLIEALGVGDGAAALPGWIGAVAALKAVSYYAQAIWMGDVGVAVSAGLRVEMADRLLAADGDALQDQPRGDVAARFADDVEVLSAGALAWVTAWVRDGSTLAVLLSLCIWLDPVLAFWALGVWPVALIPLIRLGRRLRKATGKGQSQQGALLGEVVSALDARSLLRTDTQRAAARRRFDAAIQGVASARRRALSASALSHPLMEFLGVGGLAATLWYATGRIQAGTLTAAAFVSFFAALLMLYEPIKALTRAYAQRQAALAALDRLDLLRTLPPAPDGALDAPPLQRSLTLADVTVCYDPRLPPALTAINLRIPASQTVVLTGPSGVGKSSLLRLLAGTQRPHAGAVLWDDAPYPTLRRASLAARVAYLDQNAPLLGDTIRAHLDPAAAHDDPALWRALSDAGLADHVRARFGGLDAPLSDAGANLSGGQRRRLAIAHALLCPSDVLLLDEPTDAIDPDAEAILLASLRRLHHTTTLVIVSHDPSRIPWADRVFTLPMSKR
jgi:ATP-binding cassette, subfamily B, bacterial MsbA